jgi:hypothetical protein
MRKIKLELESLAVESFDTGGERGAVLAQSLTLTPSGERTCETRETELSLDGTCVRFLCATVAVPCVEISLPPVCPTP